MATQTLTFVKVGEEYVAAFETTADFALHLERPEAGSLTLGVSSVKDGDFARVENLSSRVRYQTVFDYDFLGGIYPKYIRVASETAPTMAVVTSEGEITPIKIKSDVIPLGVSIQHINGYAYTTEEWTEEGFSNDLANGVIVATEEHKFVIAKSSFPNNMYWSSVGNVLIEGILAATDKNEALSDYSGKENTALMLNYDTSRAGYSCANFTFPNGNKGYLPALGELEIAYQNRDAIDAALVLVGSNAIDRQTGLWSSTQRAYNSAWYRPWGNGVGPTYDSKVNAYQVRPFTTL